MVLYGIGQVHRRRSAQRMRCKTSNTAIDLCPGAAFYNDTHHTPRLKVLHPAGGHSLQLMHLEVNVPRLELEFGGGLFPMQILIAWDFHKSQSLVCCAFGGTHAGLCYGGMKVQSGVLVWWYGVNAGGMVL